MRIEIPFSELDEMAPLGQMMPNVVFLHFGLDPSKEILFWDDLIKGVRVCIQEDDNVLGTS